jgi:hypothetical protein
MSTDYRALCAELHTAVQLYTGQNPAAAETPANELVARLMAALAATAAALAQPEPEGVGLSDEKLLDLADDCGLEKQEITTWDGESRTVDHGWECTDAQLVTFATALITRCARPTIEPVPVAERPWEREKGWRDPDGECWWCPPDGPPYWQMANPAMVYGGWLLPAHALPLPTPTP